MTPTEWHINSQHSDAGCQGFDVLHEKLPTQSLYMEENASKSLVLPAFASVFPRGIMYRAVDQRTVC